MINTYTRSFDELREAFELSIEKFTDFPESPKGLNEPIKYIMEIGGKRIRPLLVLLACDIYKGEFQEALKPALAIEMFHNFTLMHDDIMDEAPLRRGVPTVHNKYNVNTAILSGDVMLIYAYRLLEGLSGDKFKKIFDVFNEAAIKVCEGQQFDMNFEDETEVEIEAYLKMIELKTAVLLGCSLQVGAIVGGASNEDVNKLYEFGKNVGVAFQLQDDILDTFGDEKSFGKQIGGDILQNKKTYLLLKTRELASEEDRAVIDDWFSREEFDPKEKIATITEIYNKYNILDLGNDLKHQYTEQAFTDLNETSLSDAQKEPLNQIANKLLKRVS